MHAQPEWPPSGGSTAQDEQRRASGRGASTSTSTSTQCPDPAACPPTSNKTEKKAEKPSEQPVSAGASPTAGAEEAPPGADPLNALPPELWPPDPPRERYLLFAENDRRQAVHMIVKELRASGQCHILALADPDIIMTLNVLRKAQDRLAAVARDPQLLIKVVCSPDKDEGSPALAGEENPAEFALLFHVVLHSHAAVQQHLALGVAAPCTLLPDPGSQAPNYLRLAYPADLDPASHWKSQKRFSGRVMQELASFGVAHVSVTSSLAAAAAVRVIAMVTDALCITRDLEAVMALSYGRGAQSERDGQRDAALPRTVFTLMLAVGMDPELHGAQLPLLARCVERRRGWEQQAAEQQRQEQQQQRQQQLQQRRQQQLQQQQQQQQQQSDGGSGVHAEASIASATDGPRTLQQQQQQQQGRQSPRQQQQRRQRLRGRQKGVSLQLVDPRDLPPETAPQPQGYWVEESNGKHVWHTTSGRQIVVMYIFSATDDEFLDNLRFFIREAVHGDQLCDYVIVVQGTEGSGAHQVHLPDLPPHARYVFRRNQCYDWGTFGWLLRSRTVDARRYKYFFFINCSVRGPYLPTYARGVVHWTQPFIHRLRGDVKLVGPTISCEGSPLDGDPKSTKWRRNPHVQSYAIATDRQGLQVLTNKACSVSIRQAPQGNGGSVSAAPVLTLVLLKDRQVFRCHRSRWSTIYHSELGSSAAILAAGFNIDCFMTRYQGVDWRDPAFAECNGEMSPQGEHMSDGLTLDPFEVMFVKVKSFTLMNGVSSAVKAVRYHQWMHPPEGQEGEEAEEPGESAAGAESGSARSGAEQGERVLSVKGNGEGRATECVPLKAGVNGSQALEDGTEGREGTGAETGGSGVGSNGQCVGGSESSGAFEGRGARWRRRWRHDITTNEYLSDVPRFKVPRVLEAKARGAACFDFDFYVTNNPDLRRARVSSTSALWKHYVYFGQFEPRRYNFTCPFDYDRFAIDAEPGVSQPGK